MLSWEGTFSETLDKPLQPMLCLWRCSWQDVTETHGLQNHRPMKTEDPNTKLSLRSQGLPGRKQVKFLVVPSLSSSFISQSPILSLRDLSCHRWELSTGWIIIVAQNSTSEVSSRAGRHAATLRETGWGGGRFWACWKPGHTAFLFTQGKGRNHWFCCKNSALGEK